MQKATFKINQMDCPSEENLIRIKLQDLDEVKHLEFDLEGRTLAVYHTGSDKAITLAIAQLKLGDEKLSSIEVDQLDFEAPQSQRKLLWTILLINFSFFIIEMTTGVISKSMGLVADSLDMLADSFVYGISLLAVGGSITRKKSVAKLAGYFQIILALIGFAEVLRRFFKAEALPDFGLMMGISTLALMANGLCLYLLQRSKSKEEVHMKASMIFTSNDIIINLGVIVAGGLVYVFQTAIPDLLIGSIVFVLVIQGALRILKLSR